MPVEISICVRDHTQYTTNPSISLVVYKVIPLQISRPVCTPITSVMYYVGKGTQPYPLPVTRNGDGRITEPIGDHFSDRNLGMIPNKHIES